MIGEGDMLTICQETEDDHCKETLNSPDGEHEGCESETHDEGTFLLLFFEICRSVGDLVFVWYLEVDFLECGALGQAES